MSEKLIKGLLQLSQKANGYNIAAYFRGEFSVNIDGVFDRLREPKGFLTNIGDTYLCQWTFV